MKLPALSKPILQEKEWIYSDLASAMNAIEFYTNLLGEAGINRIHLERIKVQPKVDQAVWKLIIIMRA